VIILDRMVVAYDHNARVRIERSNLSCRDARHPLFHIEISSKHLNASTIYTTLKPCPMWLSAIYGVAFGEWYFTVYRTAIIANRSDNSS